MRCRSRRTAPRCAPARERRGRGRPPRARASAARRPAARVWSAADQTQLRAGSAAPGSVSAARARRGGDLRRCGGRRAARRRRRAATAASAARTRPARSAAAAAATPAAAAAATAVAAAARKRLPKNYRIPPAAAWTLFVRPGVTRSSGLSISLSSSIWRRDSSSLTPRERENLVFKVSDARVARFEVRAPPYTHGAPYAKPARRPRKRGRTEMWSALGERRAGGRGHRRFGRRQPVLQRRGGLARLFFLGMRQPSGELLRGVDILTVLHAPRGSPSSCRHVRHRKV